MPITENDTVAMECHTFAYRLEHVPTTEGFGLTSFATVLGDLFFRFIGNARAALQVHKDVTRHEFLYYVESNRFTYKRLLRLNYASIAATAITAPTGMYGSYPTVVDTVIACLETADVMALMGTTQAIVKQWEHATDLADIPVLDTPMQSAAKRQSYTTAAKKMRQCFDHATPKVYLFRDGYANMDVFSKCNQRLIDANRYFREVEDLITKMDRMEEGLKRILKKIDTHELQPSKTIMTQLSTHIGIMATLLDTYATAVQYLSALSHNTVITCKRLESNL